ncbi:MAG: hypothetical protein A4E48_01485 [Methanosaeta sp. PtaU1.Bin060]|nr:MAG: hypothetical protein A4E48_01485 [Methanosaeta sp. PtaU1.Bin060]
MKDLIESHWDSVHARVTIDCEGIPQVIPIFSARKYRLTN